MIENKNPGLLDPAFAELLVLIRREINKSPKELRDYYLGIFKDKGVFKYKKP